MSRRTLFTDDFESTADGPLNGTWWGVYAGWSAPRVISHTARSDGGFETVCIGLGGSSLPADQWCECTVPTFTPASSAGGLLLRMATPQTQNGYACLFGYGGNIHLYRYDAGSPISLATGSAAVAQGDTVRFEAVGTVLTGYINDVSKVSYDTVSDTTKYTGGGYAGIFIQEDSANTAVLDNFANGDYLVTYTSRPELGLLGVGA